MSLFKPTVSSVQLPPVLVPSMSLPPLSLILGETPNAVLPRISTPRKAGTTTMLPGISTFGLPLYPTPARTDPQGSILPGSMLATPQTPAPATGYGSLYHTPLSMGPAPPSEAYQRGYQGGYHGVYHGAMPSLVPSTPQATLSGTGMSLPSFVAPVPFDSPKSFAFILHSPQTFPGMEPGVENAGVPRRKRRRTSPAELAILQEEFQRCHTPSRAKRVDIASKVQMTEKAVQIWFQNRRQNLRKLHMENKQDVHVELMPLPGNAYDFHPHHSYSSPAASPTVAATSPSGTEPNLPHRGQTGASVVDPCLPAGPAMPVMQMMKTPAKKPETPQATMHSRSSVTMASGASTMTFRLKSAGAKTPGSGRKKQLKKKKGEDEAEAAMADMSVGMDDTFDTGSRGAKRPCVDGVWDAAGRAEPTPRNLNGLLLLSSEDEPQARQPLGTNLNAVNTPIKTAKGETECVEHLLSLRAGN